MEAKEAAMTELPEQVRLSPDLLRLMREAARISHGLGEQFVTTRALLLALLADPDIGPKIQHIIAREKLEGLPISEGMRARAARMPDAGLAIGERPAMQRYNTLAFKLPDGEASMWLSIEAYSVFTEGAQRAGHEYLPKHLLYGIAGEAIRVPGILATLHVAPGSLTEAVL